MIVVRTATSNDKNEVLALLDECLDFQCQIEQKKRKAADPQKVSQDQFEHAVQLDTFKVFVGEDTEANSLVGVLTYYEHPHLRSGTTRARVEDFFVTGSMRGQGVGQQLWDHMIKFAKSRNITNIKLGSGLELKPAHGFYEKQGGTTTERCFRFNLDTT